jgi:hypothetical protein
MKQFSIATTIALLLLALALPAVAGKPTITEIPFTTPFVISGGAANGACTFDVLVAPQTGKPNKERLIQFATSSVIAGPLFLTLTNQSTGKTVNLNASGPAVTTFIGGIPSSEKILGSSLVFELPPNLAAEAGLPAVALTKGQVIFTFDAQGILSAVAFNGTAQDVCQMLE